MKTEGTLACLFWNFNCQREDKEAIVVRAVDQYGIDLLVLAESSCESEHLLDRLKVSDPTFESPADSHERFQVFTRFPGLHLTAVASTPHLSMRRLRIPGYREILLGLIHFVSRPRHDRTAQLIKAGPESATIQYAEREAGHNRTVVFGDFNMNAFDDGMVSPSGFGAMMTRELAQRHSSQAGGQRFYNPSWSHFARSDPDPPGTYYWNESGQPLNIFWHSLDQILVRPALFDAFRDETFQVLASLPERSPERMQLIRNTGKHWKIEVSDHLPILFRLDLSKGADNA
jgi:endonuclease/exonuclease/phosphatase family metal-dependent hydrolase